MYALADRYLLLSPEEFAATNTLPALGEHILPTLMATEANSVRAALSFVLHAIAPASPKGQQVAMFNGHIMLNLGIVSPLS